MGKQWKNLGRLLQGLVGVETNLSGLVHRARMPGACHHVLAAIEVAFFP